MYIFPNTELWVLKDIPIDPGYENTIYFGNLNEQLGYFTRGVFTICHFYNLTYVRPTDQYVQIEWPVDALYHANYMCFRNSAFGDKMFYAFITNVEYINDRTARLYYTIDYIQSWFFEHNVGMCFVEREHTATDNPGDNLVPENLEQGEYLYDVVDAVKFFDTWSIGILSTVQPTGAGSYEAVTGGMYNGMYSAAKWFLFDTPEQANTFITGVTEANKQDAVLCVMMVPKNTQYNIGSSTVEYNEGVHIPRAYYKDYEPRNKKLLTAPYTKLLVTDYQGHAAEYAYEYMTNSTTPTGKPMIGKDDYFYIAAAMSSTPQFVCIPRLYKGMLKPLSEALLISDLPQCAYATDAYKAWMAMWSNRIGIATDIIEGTAKGFGGAISMAHGASFAEGLTTTASGLSQLLNVVGRVQDIYTLPPQTKSIGGGSAIFQIGEYGFHFLRCYIRPEFAKIIDDYFDLYGYAVKRLKYPNVRNHPSAMRPAWNYLKTIGCKIEGSVPAEVEQTLCRIYDNGIRFWGYPGDVGNYNQNNRPKGES